MDEENILNKIKTYENGRINDDEHAKQAQIYQNMVMEEMIT